MATDDVDICCADADPDERSSIEYQKRQKKIFGCFVMLGIACLLPFNCIIVPVDFWIAIYISIFLSAASMVYNIGVWVTLVYMIFKGYKHSIKVFMTFPLYIWLVCLVVIPVIHPIIKETTAKSIVTLVPILVSGIACGFFEAQLFSLGSKVDPYYNGGIMLGNGIAGLIPQAILIVIKLIVTLALGQEAESHDALFYETLTYFIVGAVIIIACICCWYWLRKQPEIIPALSFNSPSESRAKIVQEEEEHEQITIREAFRKLASPATTIFLIFTITLSIYPAITAEIPCNHLWFRGVPNTDNGWWNIGMSTAFMIFDYVGRHIWKIKIFSKPTLKACLAIAIARVVFYIFFMMALPRYSDDASVHPLIMVDELSVLVMILFAFTNGWISTLTMMKFASLFEDPADIPRGSNVETFMLITGILAGSILSLLIGLAFT